jgi:hypothetical protein
VVSVNPKKHHLSQQMSRAEAPQGCLETVYEIMAQWDFLPVVPSVAKTVFDPGQSVYLHHFGDQLSSRPFSSLGLQRLALQGRA